MRNSRSPSGTPRTGGQLRNYHLLSQQISKRNDTSRQNNPGSSLGIPRESGPAARHQHQNARGTALSSAGRFAPRLLRMRRPRPAVPPLPARPPPAHRLPLALESPGDGGARGPGGCPAHASCGSNHFLRRGVEAGPTAARTGTGSSVQDVAGILGTGLFTSCGCGTCDCLSL